MPKRLKYKYHNENDLPLENETFVFGSNLAGLHREIHSLTASQQFDAETGVSAGLTGQCYALPIKDRFIRVLTLEEIKRNVQIFKQLTLDQPERKFFVTRMELSCPKVLKTWQLAIMFNGCGRNCIFPVQWKPYLK